MSETRNDDPRRDGEISAGYRARSTETPPAELDARILAAAHRAVGSRPGGGTHRWFRWIDAPLATAAVILASATLILLMREEGMLGPRAAKEAKRAAATQERAAPAAPTAVEGGTADMPAPGVPAQTRARAEEETGAIAPQDEAPATPASAPAPARATISPKAGTATPAAPAETPRHDALPPPAPGEGPADRAGSTAPGQAREAAPEPFPAEAPATGATGRQQAAPVAESGRAAAMPSTTDGLLQAAPAGAPARAITPEPVEPQAPAANAEEAATAGRLAKDKAAGLAVQTPEERWLEEIRELIRGGRFTDAQLSLARFVKAYPDHRVPADILDALKPAD